VSENEWLRALLEQMRADLDEVKHDVRRLHEFKFKLAGGAVVASTALTLIINLIALWFKIS
jgi:hypothetical protein